MVEVSMGVFAACLPTLQSFFRRWWGDWGVMSTHVRSLWSNIGQQTGFISHLSSRDDKMQKIPSIDVELEMELRSGIKNRRPVSIAISRTVVMLSTLLGLLGLY